jgi:hypothetical protein
MRADGRRRKECPYLQAVAPQILHWYSDRLSEFLRPVAFQTRLERLITLQTHGFDVS